MSSEPTMSTPAILLSAFILAVAALLFFIWSQRAGLLKRDPEGARVIFASGEIRAFEDPYATARTR
jgi:cytochrome c oxidase cbb3-type subunit I